MYARVASHGKSEYQQVVILTDKFDSTEKRIAVESGDVRVVINNINEKEEETKEK